MPFATGNRRTQIILLSIVVLLILACLDYVTGYEFGFFIFYFIPVSIMAWYGGSRPGIAMACVSALCWYLADRVAHHPYPRPFFLYWETFMRLLSFLTTAVTLTKIRETVDDLKRLKEELGRMSEENRQLKRILQRKPVGADTPEQEM